MIAIPRVIPPPHSFTSRYNGLVNVLKTQAHVSQDIDPKAFPPQFKDPADCGAKEFTAVWDTGATNSVITQVVIDQCALKPIGIAQTHTASGTYLTETYYVNLFLPNKVFLTHLKVSRGDLTGTDILIGMDIIGQGDFAVTNHNGKTVLTFRMPSILEMDFVTAVAQLPTIPKVGRNDPCPCGSGKKYKHCHGK